ncbi:MAG: DUF3012 domain-containing protein [Gammaproteobacteria bacterium RIFCSPLOWO2_02_FULL_61_13]|nr:MAG: DUF3012 domain-containing protein [Gammaproteobacteria bacterium RIFCSPLOWO2_02_FULL_61_13]
MNVPEGFMKTMLTRLLMLWMLALAAGCAPEVGSERWCENLKQKPKGDWSANEVTDFARHCIFK